MPNMSNMSFCGSGGRWGRGGGGRGMGAVAGAGTGAETGAAVGTISSPGYGKSICFMIIDYMNVLCYLKFSSTEN